jgi:hypothetical protein
MRAVSLTPDKEAYVSSHFQFLSEALNLIRVIELHLAICGPMIQIENKRKDMFFIWIVFHLARGKHGVSLSGMPSLQ